MNSPPENREKDPGKKTAWVQMATYAELALIFPAATFVGWLMGAALDRWLRTSWLNIVGLILGIVAAFVTLIRTVMKDDAA